MAKAATLPAISCHQPWAFSIAHLEKNPENRGWATRHRGPIAIHATLKWDPAGEQNLMVQAGWINYCETLPADNVVRVPLGQGSLWITYGAVVAVADLTGCHLTGSVDHCGRIGDQAPCSGWAAEGQWHWELSNARPLRHPVPCRGRQRIWRLPPDVDAAVHAELGWAGTAVPVPQGSGSRQAATHGRVPAAADNRGNAGTRSAAGGSPC